VSPGYTNYVETFLTLYHFLVLEYRLCQPMEQREDEEANVALIRQGYLGSSPSQPTAAFTLEVLEFYHQLRRRQANFSVQSFIKVLCAIQNVVFSFVALSNNY
jgi:hypothetical protein